MVLGDVVMAIVHPHALLPIPIRLLSLLLLRLATVAGMAMEMLLVAKVAMVAKAAKAARAMRTCLRVVFVSDSLILPSFVLLVFTMLRMIAFLQQQVHAETGLVTTLACK
jgi:hypothetical protein